MGLEKECYWFVARTGAANVGGGCTKTAWDADPDLDSWMGANGEALVSENSGLSSVETDPAYFTVTKVGAFVNVPVGAIALAVGAAGSQYFEIKANPDNDSVEVWGNWSDEEIGPPTEIYIGGAFVDLPTAATKAYVVNIDQKIYCNKGDAAQTADILIAAGGTSGAMLTIESFTTAPGDKGITTFDSSAVGNVHGIVLRDIGWIKLTGFRVISAGQTAGKYGIYCYRTTGTMDNIWIDNCEAEGFDYGFEAISWSVRNLLYTKL